MYLKQAMLAKHECHTESRMCWKVSERLIYLSSKHYAHFFNSNSDLLNAFQKNLNRMQCFAPGAVRNLMPATCTRS